METKPEGANKHSLRGTKYEVMQMLLGELEEEIWIKCRKLAPEEFQKYFETKYDNFKQLCPTLYKKALDGSFAGTEECQKIIELAEDIKQGRRSKADADSVYTWWMSDRYRIQERYGKKTGPPSVPSKKAAAVKSWLFD
jgi:hypothetical protein